MGKAITIRKSGSSLVITFPKDIADLFGLKEGSQVEMEPFTSNSIQLKIKQI